MTCFEIIKKKGALYKNLKQLIKKYKLKQGLPKQVDLFHKCKTKFNYSSLDYDTYLENDILDNSLKYDELVNKNGTAIQQYQSYIKEYNALLPEKLSHVLKFKFKDIKPWIINFYENLIFKTYKLKKFHYTKVKVTISYRSPQGKNSLSKTDTYSYYAFKKHYDKVKNLINQRSTRENIIRLERAKVTPSLRIKVLKRDNYTCKKCGRTNDDIMLCIDHIIPVSKGGLTEESNLQVLCVDCNLGKSDKEN